YTEDMKRPVTEETGVATTNRKPVHPVRGKVYFEGTPAPGAMVTFFLVTGEPQRFVRTADGFVEADGTFHLSTYTANDGAPAGEYVVTVVWGKGGDEDAPAARTRLPERYARPEASPLRFRVQERENDVVLELKK